MTRVIYKYSFSICGAFTLSLPKGFKILSVQVQAPHVNGGTPTMWVMVDPNEQIRVAVGFRIYGTGHAILDPINVQYVATILQEPYVWHLFREGDD